MAVTDAGVEGPLALAGRVVVMDEAGTVVQSGVVYAREGSIVAVSPLGANPPAGFEEVPLVDTEGTLFPGLIELHNHLPYDVLPLWNVPKRYTNRDQWTGSTTSDYHRLVSGPMGVLGRDPDVVPAIIRYVEVRCLLGGTTTSQGVALAVNPGIVKLFRGLVRNVESTGEDALPAAVTHIADIDATDVSRFLARLNGPQKLLLHLSEGTDTKAREHFLALGLPDGRWAITANLIGIHCTALTRPDFAVLAAHGGSMVWSPLSNLLLYGQTAQLGAALAEGVQVALGSDWAPSGSKNLLGELKAARLAAPLAGATVSDRELIAMATRTPAQMLGWGDVLGTVEKNKRADLIVVHGTTGDPYDQLLSATEADIDLVVINGVPRAGTTALMTKLKIIGERVHVGGHYRIVNLTQTNADPTVAPVSVAEAVHRLRSALQDLPNPRSATGAFDGARRSYRALLAVDGVINNGMTSRPHLPYRGRFTGPNLPQNWTRRAIAAAPAGPLPSLTLDSLAAVDNPDFYKILSGEQNLPATLQTGLTH